jgi:hypothetical protein
MRLSRCLAWACALALALVLPAMGQAGAIFKCQGPGGKTTFSDAPCPVEHKQETVRAAPPPGFVDVDAVCNALARRPSLASSVMSACMSMRTCEATKDAAACNIYCRDFPDGMIPGVKFGLGSAACVAHTKRARGSNWAQTQEREPPNGISKYDMLRYACIDTSGRAAREHWVLCEPGTTSCTSPTPTNGVLGPFAELDGLLTRTCRNPGGAT